MGGRHCDKRRGALRPVCRAGSYFIVVNGKRKWYNQINVLEFQGIDNLIERIGLQGKG